MPGARGTDLNSWLRISSFCPKPLDLPSAITRTYDDSVAAAYAEQRLGQCLFAFIVEI